MADIPGDLGAVAVTRGETSTIVLGGDLVNYPNLQFNQLLSNILYNRDLIGSDPIEQSTFTEFKQIGIASISQGRLTLETGVPVSTSDQLAQSTLYYTPYLGDYVALYDTPNTRWDLFQFTERSLALGSLLADTIYDIFIYDNAGVITLEAVAWASSAYGASSRATAISQLNGIYVKSTDNRRYLGAIMTTSVAGQCEDSLQRRFVWNVSNQITRPMRYNRSDAHSYSAAVYRPFNNQDLLKVEFVSGLVQFVQFWTSLSFGTGNTVTRTALNDVQLPLEVNVNIGSPPTTGAAGGSTVSSDYIPIGYSKANNYEASSGTASNISTGAVGGYIDC